MKIVALNKKALFDYEILDKIEAGIVLTGDEVKSVRAGQVSLIGAFAVFHEGELYLINCRISPYAQAYKKDEEQATRRRKLLLHRKELNRLVGEISRKGVTLVPLRMYFTQRNVAKVELGIGKHKKAVSKKQDIKERDIKRQTRRELKGKYEY
jgi:SsrA-binding protein